MTDTPEPPSTAPAGTVDEALGRAADRLAGICLPGRDCAADLMCGDDVPGGCGVLGHLADTVISAVPAGGGGAVLRWLARERLAAVVLPVLDECDESTYFVAGELAAVLHAAVIAQDREGAALRSMVCREISDRAALLARIRAAERKLPRQDPGTPHPERTP